MRFKLRTLLILAAILPPLIYMAWLQFAQPYLEWKAQRERDRAWVEEHGRVNKLLRKKYAAEAALRKARIDAAIAKRNADPQYAAMMAEIEMQKAAKGSEPRE